MFMMSLRRKSCMYPKGPLPSKLRMCISSSAISHRRLKNEKENWSLLGWNCGFTLRLKFKILLSRVISNYDWCWNCKNNRLISLDAYFSSILSVTNFILNIIMSSKTGETLSLFIHKIRFKITFWNSTKTISDDFIFKIRRIQHINTLCCIKDIAKDINV